MSGIEINKIAGAILTAALLAMVVGIIGDTLVHPRKHTAANLEVKAVAPAAPEEKKELPPIGPLLASASAEVGAKIANKCKACHDLTNARKTKVGPPLWDVVEANKGHVKSYSYSNGMKSAGGKWTYEDLNKFLHKPKEFVKGTKMTFAGLKKAKERADVIAYLRTLSDSPKPLP